MTTVHITRLGLLKTRHQIPGVVNARAEMNNSTPKEQVQHLTRQTHQIMSVTIWLRCLHSAPVSISSEPFCGRARGVFRQTDDSSSNGGKDGGAEFARNWICKERGWKLQGKEYSRKGSTIRIRVNLQGMDLSRKLKSGICKEHAVFARKGICKEQN